MCCVELCSHLFFSLSFFSSMEQNTTKEEGSKPKAKKRRRRVEANQRNWKSRVVGGDPRLLIHQSQFRTGYIDTDYHHMICLGFAPVHRETVLSVFICCFFVSLVLISFSSTGVSGARVPVGGRTVLHGLSAQQVSRQQIVDGGGASHHAGVVATAPGGSP